MTNNQNNGLKAFVRQVFPYGLLFAERSNFEAGYFIEEARLVAKYLKPQSDVLVIGSGNGREARPICRSGHRIVCVDIAQMYLKSGQNLFAMEGIKNVHFLQAGMAQIPFGRESFDFIFFSLYTYAGESRFDILGGIHRVLRSDGFVLLSASTPLMEMMQPPIAGEVFVANAKQCRQEVSSCGFELLESAADPLRPEYCFSILRKQDTKDDTMGIV